MKIRHVIAVGLMLTAVFPWASTGSAQSTQRPLADWLGPNMAEPILEIWFEPGNPDFAFIDYFGRMATNNGLALGSSFDGQVTERPRKDGRADVHVVLHSRSVLAYAYDTSQGNVLVFGHSGAQVKIGADPARLDPQVGTVGQEGQDGGVVVGRRHAGVARGRDAQDEPAGR